MQQQMQQQQQQHQQQQQQSQSGPYPSPNEQNVIKPPQQSGPPPSGLAVQRPIINTSSQIRPIGPASSVDYGSLMNSRDHPPPMMGSSRPPPSMFDALASQNQHVLNFGPDPLQSSYQSHMGLAAGGNLPHISRLNPKASAFSAIPPSQNHQSAAPGSKLSSSNQFGNMFHQNPPPGPIGKYQNLPPNGGGPGMPPYRGSNQQSHGHGPPPGGNRGGGSGSNWFTDLAHLQSRDPLMNIENGLAMALGGSPTISPNNNNQPTTNGGPGGPPGQDDGRKISRAIGSERASWKFNYGSSGGIGAMDNDPSALAAAAAAAAAAAGTTHWMVDKNLSMGGSAGGPQQWMGPPPRHFMDDLHLQDHFQSLAMEYPHNTGGGSGLGGNGNGPNQQQQQANMNFMQSLQYQFMPGGPADMVGNDGPSLQQQQQQQQQQPWEHEKHGWPAKWSGH